MKGAQQQAPSSQASPSLALILRSLVFISTIMGAFCDNEHITTAREFIAFSDAVNSGTNFKGTTVYLDSDIDFTDELSEQFKVIGNDDNNFRGTFDGQGHAIRNLVINASSSNQTVGLFGGSKGTTIRNVVIDKTCSFTSNFISNKYVAYTGSIISACQTDGPCTLENNVNMANVTFNGNTSGKSSFIGGVVGEFISTNNQGFIKNCANYGTVSSSGTSDKGAYIGGIIGSPQISPSSSSNAYAYVQNCANYGTILYNGSSGTIFVGGISGYSVYSTTDNCVSSGPIVIDSDSANKSVGSIVGYAASSSTITHCYWNMSIKYDVCGYKLSYTTITNSYSFNPSTFELAEPVTIGDYAGTSLIGALNGAADYYILRDYSHWALNKDSRDVSFTVNGRSQPSFTTNTQVILLPDLASEGNVSFSGWYTGSACTVPLTDFIIDSDEKKDLYGLLTVDENNYTINFDTRGGSDVPPITSPYGSTVELPTNSARPGCKFLNWETEYGYPVTTSFTVPSRNITLYAVWLCERITTARELIAFSDAVNSGTSFTGMTVYLDSDIDFTDGLSHQFKVINIYFRGTFDGQGHMTRNLAVNASSSNQIVGLFGYSAGATIRNVVIDETCSFTNNFVSNENFNVFIGSIIGICQTDDGSCTLENSVNMARVVFNGNTGFSYTGGIVGKLYISEYGATTKNCANYGTVSSTGTSVEGTCLGGIVGSFQGNSSSTLRMYVQNCANYGTVHYNGATNKFRIGSISGYSYYGTIDNCVSSGPIVIDSSSSVNKSVGSIVGYALYSTIIHCYWNASIGYDVCGYKYSSTITDSYSFNPSTFELAGSVSIRNYTGSSLIGALNGAADYYILRDYSHWALNKDSRNVSFTVNKTKLSFTTNTQVILLPDLAGGGNMSFNGWYTDSACTVPLADFTINSDEKKDLYGLLAVDENNYTINFDTRGGSALSSITSPYGSTVELKNATRSGCKFLNWETKYGYPVTTTSFTVPSRNITLYAVWLCEHITTARELITFSDAVNSGTNFKGVTVYLDSDIDFTDELSHQFKVINIYFRGTFDGQGHVIRNLAINSSSCQYVGLFGYSLGTTIRNVIIDETCSFTNNYVSKNYDTYTGGIISACKTNDSPCILENNVNIASITFNGNTGKSYTGGIVGALSLTNNIQVFIKNCANYGTVSNIGTSMNNAYLGGINGFLQGSSTSTFNAYVQNCANYGTVFYNGSSSIITIGGVSGYNYYNTIENCVSSGPIVVDSSISSTSKYVGSIVGYAASLTTTTHCYWTLDVGCNDITGYSDGSVTTTETTYTERLNTTTLDELNAYAASATGFSQWVVLRLNGGSVSNLTQSDLVVAQEHFPSPVKEGNTFLRWCKDLECGEVYDNDLTGITALYAVWETVRVTFTFWNGTTTAGPVSVEYGTAYGALPEAGTVVEGHTFCWFMSNDDDGGDERVVTPDTIVTTTSDHTLHGRWVANNYTVALDLGNGTVITRTFQYNKTIELPQGIAREGCTHTGWDNSTTTTTMPAMNITINALWDCTHNSGDKSKSSSNAGAIVGGVVGGLVGVVLIVFAVLVLLMLLKKKESTTIKNENGIEMKGMNSRIVEKSLNASEAGCCDDNSSSTLSESLSKLYSGSYKVPTIAETLYMAGLSEDNIIYVDEACTLTGSSAAKEGKLFDGFEKEDAAAVALYTFDFGGTDYEINPYRIINKALASNSNDEDLKKASGLLYLVLSALRKLPRHTGGSLYRGIREGVDVTSYKEGSTVVWHGLSSTSPDMSATKAFLAKSTASKKAEGTLFVIDKGWGYDIQPYSLFPEEAEILIEPKRRFRVQSVIEAELTVINLEMIDTPVILPEIFGEDAN